MSSCSNFHSYCQTNSTEATLDFVMLVALDRILRTRLEAYGLTPDERRRGCQLALDAATAALEPRCHADDAVIEAEAEIEAWTLIALRRLERKLAPDFPEQYLFLTDGLEPGWGIAAVPVAKAMTRRIRALKKVAGHRTLEERTNRSALGALENRHFTARDIERIEELIDRVEVASRMHGDVSLWSPEEARVRQWLGFWSTIATAVLEGRNDIETPRDSEPPSSHLPSAA